MITKLSCSINLFSVVNEKVSWEYHLKSQHYDEGVKIVIQIQILDLWEPTPHLQGKLGSPPQERTRLIKNYTSSLHVNMLANLQFDAQDQNFTITRPDIRHVPYWPFTHHWLWIIHVMMHSKLDATKFQQKRTTIRMMRDSSLLGSNFHHNHPFFSWLNDARLVFTQIDKASVECSLNLVLLMSWHFDPVNLRHLIRNHKKTLVKLMAG